jgi:hypothetical protein
MMNKTWKKKENLLLAGCLSVTALVHLPILANYFVADSWVFMVPHSFLDNFTYFYKSMLPPEHNALWLRPIPMFSFWLDTVLWPDTICCPHAVNILFHLINVSLIWKIIRFMSGRLKMLQASPEAGFPALAACLVYGLHPLTVGSVGWVAARFDVMSVTFGLAGMLMWLKWDSGASRKRYLVWSLLLFLLSIFSKEQGIVFSAACFVMSLIRVGTLKKERRRILKGLTVLSLMAVVYILYRLIIFRGIGGYIAVESRLSIYPPLYYLLTLVYPYLNVLPGWTFSWTFGVAVIVIITIGIFLWKKPPRKAIRIPLIYFVCAAALCAFGLATTATSPGLTFERVLDHTESRFALNSIAGLSLMVGIAVNKASVSSFIYRIILGLTIIWSITAAWRTDIQIQAWKDAGDRASAIVQDTLRMAPDPPLNSRLYFIDIPLANDQWAYIFGIGLKEALLLKYKTRSDITVIRFPKREDLLMANPERDFIFRYVKSKGRLERLHAKKKNNPGN